MIKYLGSKRLLIPKIVEIIKKENAKTVIDLFSGTSRVGHALQNEGINVISNDINGYAYILAQTYVLANPEDEKVKKLPKIIEELNKIPPKQKPGWFTETYCEKSNFFQVHNGLKIEAIREEIEKKYSINSIEKSILLTSLIEASDRVDSTCGVQMAYLKQWSKRSYNNLELRMPKLSKGNGISSEMSDAKEAAKFQVDLAYIDPPYNQHNYRGNYHIWETIRLWDKPETYGKAQKRIDVKSEKSNWNSKKLIFDEFMQLIQNLGAEKALISFNDEGYLSKDDILGILKTKFGQIDILEVPYQRYVGAKIGIHNKNGEKVGKISHLMNHELLFLAKNK
jgi:adenine-specific DNA-methyltransferase